MEKEVEYEGSLPQVLKYKGDNIPEDCCGIGLDKSGKIISVVNAGWQYLKMILNEYYKADDKRSAK